MDCDRFNEISNDYIDGALGEILEALAAEHVADCPDCAAEVRALRRTRDLTKQYGSELAPEGFEAAVRARIESELRARRTNEQQGGARQIKFGRLPKWAALAATFAIVVLAGMHFNVFRFSPGGGVESAKIVTSDRVSSGAGTAENKSVIEPAAVPQQAELKQAKEPAETREGAKNLPAAAADQPKEMIASGKGAVSELTGERGGGSASLFEASPAAPARQARKSYVAESVAPATDETAAVASAIENYESHNGLASGAGAANYSQDSEAKSATALGRVAAAKSKSESSKSGNAYIPPAPEYAPVVAQLAGYTEGGAAYDYYAPSVTRFTSDEESSPAAETSADFEPAPGSAKKADINSDGRVQIARAADVINTPDPAAAFQKCMKIIKEFGTANPGSGAHWQSSGNQLFIIGPYKIIVRLREKLVVGFGGVKPAPAAAAQTASSASAIGPDMPTVLTVYINKRESSPATAPAADAASPAKDGGK